MHKLLYKCLLFTILFASTNVYALLEYEENPTLGLYRNYQRECLQN